MSQIVCCCYAEEQLSVALSKYQLLPIFRDKIVSLNFGK